MKLASLFALVTLLCSISSYAQLLPPTDTLTKAMQKPLTLVGRYVSPTSSSGRISACVFRNEDVTVVYEYCTKPASPAISVIIFDHALGGKTLQIYAEGTMDPSRIRRAFYYDVFWRASSRQAPEGFTPTLTAPQFRELEQSTKFAAGCSVFFMEGMGEMQLCSPTIEEAEGAAWLAAGALFWSEPGEAWYGFQRHMRSLIDRTL